jgi:hypothetical protein
VDLLWTDRQSVRIMVTWATTNLLVDKGPRAAFIEAGGIAPLLSLAEMGAPNMQRKALEGLRKLAADAENLPKTVEANVVALLAQILRGSAQSCGRRR